MILRTLLTTAALAASTAFGDGHAFVDVTVIPMDREGALRNQTVLVDGDRIVAMGNVQAIDVPEGMETIDGTGLYLMPGLADMHVHTWVEDERHMYLGAGVTTVRNMWGAPMHHDIERRAAAGEIEAPRIYSAGALLDGDPPIWPNSTVLTDVEEARSEIRAQHEEGYDFIKVYNRLEADVYAAIVETAAEEGIRVVGHVPNAVGLHGVLAAKQSTIEHLSGYVEACRADDAPARGFGDTAGFDESKLGAIVEATLDAGTWNCPTLIVMHRISTSGDEVEGLMARPEMRYVNPIHIQGWQQRSGGNRHDRQEHANAVYATIVRALHDAGAPILLGTDTPNPWVIPGFAIHEELAFLVNAGLSPYDAIRAGTADAARFLGEDDLGVVRAGARADLLLIEGNPLEDVANIKRLRGVMTRGTWLERSVLEARLEAVAASNDIGDRTAGEDSGVFDDVPDLPSDGRVRHAARYVVKMGDNVVGEERTVILEKDGAIHVHAQAVYPAFGGSGFQIHLDPGERGLGETLTATFLGQDTAPVVVRRSDGGFTMTVGSRETKYEAAHDARLGSMFVAAEYPHLENLISLSVGSTHRQETVGLGLIPMPQLQSSTTTTTRVDDIQTAGGTTHRVYEVQTTSGGSTSNSTYVVDDTGRFVSMRIETPMGEMSMTRVE